ncbi:uncharacterized protein DEA37_0013281 [Paragonimus westermani]|uniref:Uncharacterized protein n=1 Tax=Paragonimus westermani TaxID=34504 RepID=A0A5J4N6G7_9TREM|nr:uncharacterized protein DEA37_0013281 [Paragonimus westermani]
MKSNYQHFLICMWMFLWNITSADSIKISVFPSVVPNSHSSYLPYGLRGLNYRRNFTLSGDYKLIATKSRRHNFVEEDFISKKLHRLIPFGIIEPCSLTWRAQFLVVSNGRQKKQMAVNHSQSVNNFTLIDACSLPKVDKPITKMSKYATFGTLNVESAHDQIAVKGSENLTVFLACDRLYHFWLVTF